MVSSKNVKVSQKRCLGTSTESFTSSAPSEQIIEYSHFCPPLIDLNFRHLSSCDTIDKFLDISKIKQDFRNPSYVHGNGGSLTRLNLIASCGGKCLN